eukprot:6236538-Pyramimonas_sp.AAC.1
MFQTGARDWGVWAGADLSIQRHAGQAWGTHLSEITVGGDLVAQNWRGWEARAGGQVRGAQFTAAAALAAHRRWCTSILR